MGGREKQREEGRKGETEGRGEGGREGGREGKVVIEGEGKSKAGGTEWERG